MTNYYNNNCEYLLFNKPKHISIIFICIIFLIFMIILSLFVETYDLYNSKAYIDCNNECKLIITIPTNDKNKLNKINYINIEEKAINIKKVEYSDNQVDFENKLNYVILTLYTDDVLSNKTIQDIKIFYNKETLFKKTLNLFLK